MAGHNQPPSRVAKTQNTFFGGAATLAIGIMVVKIIGMFYKIPLINVIGDQGTTDFYNAYYIYSVLLSISTAGLPVAVSKLVSESNALNHFNQTRRTLSLALRVFLALGLISFLVMFFFSQQLADGMNDPMAAAGIKALAPAVVCVGCLSAFRGYCQGHGDMAPTAISQILEAACKLAVGLGLAMWLIHIGQPAHIAAAGAITGVTVGTILALVYMLLNFGRNYAAHPRLSDDVPQSDGAIFRRLLALAIPITLTSSMVAIGTLIDTSLVQGRVQHALIYGGQAAQQLYASSVDFSAFNAARDAWQAAVSAGSSQSAVDTLFAAVEEEAVAISRTLYGNYSGAVNIYGLPTSLMAAITASVIPAISAAVTRRDRKGAGRITASALRITALLALPMGVGLVVMGEPIMALLFPSLDASVGGRLLSGLGIGTPFVCLMLVCNAVLQAYGFVNLPVVILVIGTVFKVAVDYFVVVMPSVGIYGAPLGNSASFIICLVLDLILMARVIPTRLHYRQLFTKTIISALVMGAGAWGVYGLLSRLSIFQTVTVDQAGNQVAQLTRLGLAVSTMGAIGVAVVLYGALVVALRVLTREDLALMPKGEKLARLLRL